MLSFEWRELEVLCDRIHDLRHRYASAHHAKHAGLVDGLRVEIAKVRRQRESNSACSGSFSHCRKASGDVRSKGPSPIQSGVKVGIFSPSGRRWPRKGLKASSSRARATPSP